MFFFDNCISPKLARIFRIMGAEVLHLRDEYAPDTADLMWISEVGAKGYIALTVDGRILRNVEEREARRAAKLRTLFLHDSFANSNQWQQLVKLATWWPAIQKAADKCKEGQCFKFSAHGKAEPLTTP